MPPSACEILTALENARSTTNIYAKTTFYPHICHPSRGPYCVTQYLLSWLIVCQRPVLRRLLSCRTGTYI